MNIQINISAVHRMLDLTSWIGHVSVMSRAIFSSESPKTFGLQADCIWENLKRERVPLGLAQGFGSGLRRQFVCEGSERYLTVYLVTQETCLRLSAARRKGIPWSKLRGPAMEKDEVDPYSKSVFQRSGCCNCLNYRSCIPNVRMRRWAQNSLRRLGFRLPECLPRRGRAKVELPRQSIRDKGRR